MMPSAPSEITSIAETTFNTILFQGGLVPCAVIPVSGEPVQLPDDDHIKELFAAVFNHILELRAVICLGGKGAVNIVA